MLEEYLKNAESDHIDLMWHGILPGVNACMFSTHASELKKPVHLPVVLEPMHFEAFYCTSGTLILGRKHGNPQIITKDEILLLSDNTSLTTAQITVPLNGIAVFADGNLAMDSFMTLCKLLGDLPFYLHQVFDIMNDADGSLLLRDTVWIRNVFSVLHNLSQEEKAHYSVMKTVELLYLLCTHSILLQRHTDLNNTNSYLNQLVTDMQAYMKTHLDEKLTIEHMSQQYHISPTAFKSAFKHLYGQPVHSWLQTQRMRQAAEYLYSSPMSILQIAQAVGYEGVSQFNLLFKRQYGITPSQYKKLSNTGDI